MLRAVCLDMGETLVEYRPASEKVLGELLQRHGVKADINCIHRAYLLAKTWYALQTIPSSLDGRPPDEQRALFDGFDRMLLNGLGLGDRSDLGPSEVQAAFAVESFGLALYPDTLSSLAALRARGLRLAIVSNWSADLVDGCTGLGLTEHFDAIVGSTVVGVEKPDPRIFDYALWRIGVSPSEAWHVGDLYLTDVLGARAAGLRPVLLDRHDVQDGVDCRRVRGLGEIIEMVDQL